MISAQDKQKILNGAYGITREGERVKFIGEAETNGDHAEYPYHFIILSTNNKILGYLTLTQNLTNYETRESLHDVVGLWEDRPDPFDVERALAGEPVMTRDRSKAYVQAIISQPKGLEHYNLIGFGYNGEHKEFLHWDKTGKVTADDITCDDIIGMWKEPATETNT